MKLLIFLLASICAAQVLPLTSVRPSGAVFPVSGGGGGACTPASGYSHCRVLTVDHTQVGGSTLSSFPVLVSTALGASRIQNASCFDVVFTSDSGGTTLIPWEQESCTQATGTIVDWVLGSSLSSSSDTLLYVSYDNGSISTAQNTGANGPTHVWDSNYKGVYHFGDGVTLSLNDSTSNANNLHHFAGTSTAHAGPFGGGVSYPGSTGDQNNSIGFSSDLTVEFWSNETSIVSGSGHFTFNSTNYEDNFDPGLLRFIFNGNSIQISYSTTGAWSSFAMVGKGDGSLQAIYLDGSVAITGAGVTSSGTSNLIMGLNFNNFMQGFLSEFRVSDSARSTGWISAEYNNQKSGQTFLTVGSEV